MKSAVALVSGGLNSAALLYDLRDKYTVCPLFFNFGQANALAEYRSAQSIAKVTKVGAVDGMDIPHSVSGCPPKMQQAAMIVFAWSYALLLPDGFDCVAIGASQGLSIRYLREFNEAMSLAMRFGSLEMINGTEFVYSPFDHWDKCDILMRFPEAPFGLTFSCRLHSLESYHCGTCEGCLERKQAFLAAEIPDRTPYADDEGVFRG